MFIPLDILAADLDKIEEIEKASMRLVTQAVYDFREQAAEIFLREADFSDIGEDTTREALDRMGVSKIGERLFGKIDYKRARYVFHPDYAVKQALLVDSKAERTAGRGTATLQTAQTSLRIRHIRAGEAVDIPGTVPSIKQTDTASYLTTTIFVKYHYQQLAVDRGRLVDIVIAALPNGLLQDRYNPTAQETIWLTGRNAPTLGEAFRVRLTFARLKAKAKWRVQAIPMAPDPFVWDD
ncbi:MAG: SfiI family type II restriction endonuclease [Acidobacteriota bacterium]